VNARTLLFAFLLSACGGSTTAAPIAATPPPVQVAFAEAPPPEPDFVTLSVVGTNDLHGHLARTAVLSGFLSNLRAARDADHGAVLLLDGGDMFQGTLESNLVEGASVVRAYDALHYTAATIGNHEFDYGPVGPAATPQSPEDDPRGALLARAAELNFPLLSANLRVAATGAGIDWPHVAPTVMIDAGGVKVGLVGVTTKETLGTTLHANVADLAMAPIVETVTTRARALREAGAEVIVVLAHAGGFCHDFSNADDLSSCQAEDEIFEVARALPAGLVDVIVAGHTHRGVAHRVNGVVVLESYAYGRAFGRVDIEVDRTTGHVASAHVFAPQDLCQDPNTPVPECTPGEYEGRPVVVDAALLTALAPDLEHAREARERSLGATLSEPITSSYLAESPLGDLLADLMREAHPGADVGLLNGGGVRADWPAGPLTYGSLYESFPFDNVYASVRITGAELTELVRRNLGSDHGVLLVSGVNVRARCAGPDEGASTLEVTLTREGGRRIRPDETLTLVTSDFLATGGDGVLADIRAQRPDAITIEDGPPIREAIAALLPHVGDRGIRRSLAHAAPRRPRMTLPATDSARPIRCPAPNL